jgi:ATP-dependent Clp protease ATP-binding subunit ClpB
LKRAVQQLVENPLAQRLLKGEFAAGDTVHVGLTDGEIDFH